MSDEVAVAWHHQFAKVINCKVCTLNTDKNLLRDDGENVPQPGYIGRRYSYVRLLLVGQNPAEPPDGLLTDDRSYTASLRTLRDAPTIENYEKLARVLDRFIPKWPIHGRYFPLNDCRLTLADVAYFNLVRCRTKKAADPKKGVPAPNDDVAGNCRRTYFGPWLDLLKPKAVVFIGKWASDYARQVCVDRRIPSDFVNRSKSLKADDRAANIAQVVSFVTRHAGKT